jgi:hypothetical protein
MSDEYSKAVLNDVFRMFCGKRMGNGISRTVYECDTNPDWVIKVEDNGGRFQNIVEWETWQYIKEFDEAKWLAPCLHISPCGMVLIMKRTIPPTPKQYPKRMPAFLADFKRTNYGMIKNRIVCHDYGTHLLMEHGRTQRMRKVDWWELE